MSYNFVNPVNVLFATGFAHLFAAHTSANNNGTFTIFKINQAGNNIWVKNAIGVTQGAAAGTADTNVWTFALTAPASVTDYIVGEKAKTAGHTSAGNNQAALPIISVNFGGNNLLLHNASGVVQGGAAGTINTNRWKYNLPSDPTAQVAVNDTMYMAGHTSALNDGVFSIKEITVSTVVVYNESGVAQGGTAGTQTTTRKLVKFSSDLSLIYTTASYVELEGCVSSLYNKFFNKAPFRVLEVNRGGGANYNIVIDVPTGPAQPNPAGYVQVEMKSIFTVSPSLAVDVTGNQANENVVGSSVSLVNSPIPALAPLMLYLTSYPSGDPRDLTVSLI